MAEGTMDTLIWLRPWWLLGLVPLLGLAVLSWRRPAFGPWGRLIGPEMLAILARLGWARGGGRDLARLWLPLAGLALVLALAGPAIPREGREAHRRLDPMLLLLDLSPSIVASPGALTELRSAALRLLQGNEGRPVGLLVWAADAYLVSSPTTDAAGLEGTLAVLGADTMPVAGSRPDMALTMARDLFTGSGRGPGLGGADLVVISDGAGIGPRAEEEARRLASDGARIWGLAIDLAAPGAPAPDPAALQRLALAGGGISLTAPEAQDLGARIAAAAQARLVRDPASGIALHDFGPWLLALAMICLLPLWRREGA